MIRKFSALLVSIFVLLIGIIGLFISQTLKKNNQADNLEIAQNESAHMGNIVENVISGAYNLGLEFSETPDILSLDAEKGTPLLVNAAKNNTYMELLYSVDTNGMQKVRSIGEPADRSTRWWFQQMQEEKQAFVSKSYFSATTKVPCTSIFYPMYNNGEYIGMFGIDLKLDYIQSLMQKYADSESDSYTFIIDGDGVVIAHPDDSYVSTFTNFKTLTYNVPKKDAEGNIVKENDTVVEVQETFDVAENFKTTIAEVMDKKSGSRIISIDDKLYFAGYSPISLPGISDSWSVITVSKSIILCFIS